MKAHPCALIFTLFPYLTAMMILTAKSGQQLKLERPLYFKPLYQVKYLYVDVAFNSVSLLLIVSFSISIVLSMMVRP
ncbi:hypothetical protein ZIOFF_020352 [Zingiber officinale]|uniref:NADH dehydrogenase subunit 5 n=1 Tax=Zingiber officinale TaxID=94328 RepID=A0A8J5L7W3_ZINOF|nr:hypothetical protein ZIOFF_020352 [Zingiber officinale]